MDSKLYDGITRHVKIEHYVKLIRNTIHLMWGYGNSASKEKNRCLEIDLGALHALEGYARDSADHARTVQRWQVLEDERYMVIDTVTREATNTLQGKRDLLDRRLDVQAEGNVPTLPASDAESAGEYTRGEGTR